MCRVYKKQAGAIFAVLIAVIFSGIICPLTLACVPVSETGIPIAVAHEEAIIVYDSTTKTERFIRGAAFASKETNFGFLVPTPTLPTLTDTSPILFETLENIMSRPVVRWHPRYIWGLVKSELTAASVPGIAKSLAESSVTVYATKRVGDFDTVVLKATNALALNRWLAKHHYHSRPEVTEWLMPYIHDGWFITAFRISSEVAKKKGNNTSLSTSRIPITLTPICMTFTTDTPFYPYREATDAVSLPDRLLRVFLITDKKVEGYFKTNPAQPWSAQTVQARTLTDEDQKNIKSQRLNGKIGSWLTVFEDRSTNRSRSDLYFQSAKQQTVQVPIVDDIYFVDIRPGFYGCVFIVIVLWGGITWLRTKKIRPQNI